MTKLNMKRIVAYTILAGAISGCAASAHQGSDKGMERAERAERMFERMDTNKDGIATVAEVQAAAAARFVAMDADGNGEVTREERKQFRQARRFARIDTNGDGQISPEEMQAKSEHRGKRRGHRRGHGKREAGKGGPVTMDMVQTRALERFARIDVDGDGQITLADVKNAKPRGRKK